ncbi:MAG: class I SAM-dependent methyltransferase [Vagococcus sp.]|uniref:class I SAM-dependent methyltransferase n=1 Tax=Vagococcus sp. TaxID=1933889 RepID=UPI002FC9A28C
MYNHYGPLATKVYELTKPIGASLNGDIDYYSERLDGISGKILEAGVGSGRMLIPLLKEGFDIEGIDQSFDMLAACQASLSQQQLATTIHQGNLADFLIAENYYEAIIMPTATFCLLETEKLAYQTLINFYRHLKIGGKIIIDIDLPFYPELGETSTTSFPINTEELITYEKKIVEIDWFSQHIISHLTYSYWQKGELIKQELQQFLLRWYGLNEFRLMLEKVGFKEISISADYEFDEAPTNSNQTITFEGKK